MQSLTDDPAIAGFHNQLLARTAQKVEAGLIPENKDDFLKIVVSGMKVAMNPGQGGKPSMAQQLAQSQDPINDAAKGAVNLTALMARQSRGKMPERAFVPAAMVLMLHALDVVDRIGKVKIDEQAISKATKTFTDQVFRVMGVSQEQLQSMAQKAHGFANQPGNMDKLGAHAKTMMASRGQQQAAPAPAPGGPTPIMNQ